MVLSALDGSSDVYGIFEQGGFSDNQAIQQGYMKASGTELKFKEFGQDPSGGGGQENNIALEYLSDGDLSGIYAQIEMIMPSSNFGSVFQKSKKFTPPNTKTIRECDATLASWAEPLIAWADSDDGRLAIDGGITSDRDVMFGDTII